MAARGIFAAKYNPTHAVNHGTQDPVIEPFHQIKKEILGSLDGLGGMYPPSRATETMAENPINMGFGLERIKIYLLPSSIHSYTIPFHLF